MPLEIINTKLEELKVNSIVNFDNDKVEMKTGIAHQLYLAAGAIDTANAIKKHLPLQVGDIFMTPAYRLEARNFIHVIVGRIDKANEAKEVKDILLRLLNFAANNDIKSLAIPYGKDSFLYQYKDCYKKIIEPTIRHFINIYPLTVYLVK